MAFTQETFTLNRATTNSVTGPASVAIHTYKTTDDILAVLSSGYFNNIAFGLVPGDIIYAVATTAGPEVPIQFIRVTGTSPVTTTPFL